LEIWNAAVEATGGLTTGAELTKLGFRGFALRDEAIFNLELHSIGRLELPNGEWLLAQPLGVDHGDRLRLALSIGAAGLRTELTLSSGTPAVVVGPSFEVGALVLALDRPARTPARE